MRPLVVIIYFIALAIVAANELRIRGKVKKRHNTHRRHRAVLPPCNFNESLIEDEWALMEAIGKSKFIFTGKVLTVKKFRSIQETGSKRSNLYRIYVRRVLKGDDGELKFFVKQEGPVVDSLSGAIMTVERGRALDSCAPTPRPRLSAIFLSDGVYLDERGHGRRLQLLTDPIPLTLYHLDRVNAAVKANLSRKVSTNRTGVMRVQPQADASANKIRPYH